MNKRKRFSELKDLAKGHRNSPSEAYQVLWSNIRKNQLGVRFRRRHVLFDWILDFYCAKEHVAIEIDYPSDQMRTTEHNKRDQTLREKGIRVFRVSSSRVLGEIDAVLSQIEAFIQEREKPD